LPATKTEFGSRDVTVGLAEISISAGFYILNAFRRDRMGRNTSVLPTFGQERNRNPLQLMDTNSPFDLVASKIEAENILTTFAR
jgi:hypothetical protein